MANTKIQIKRTNVAGRTPNTTDPSNTSYIAAGEFALNMADKILYTSNGSDVIAVGASQDTITATTGNFNNIATDGGISIGNSSVNASINSTALFAGNAASNVVVNTTILTVSNSITNSTITSGSIFTGNSVANAQFNIGIGAVSLTINSYSYSSTTGIATFTTSADHGLSGQTKGLYVTVSGLPTEVSTFNGTNEIYTLPANNQFTIKKFIGGQIVSASRTNGVATVTTKAAHGFATNDVIGVSGINPDITYAGFDFNGTQTVTSVPSSTTFTYANYPKINATISSFYVNTSESKQPVYVTGTAHGFATNMPVSTTTTIEANVTANVYGFFLNPDSGYALGPKLGFDVPSLYLVLGSGTNINNFSSGIKMSVATPGPQYSSYTSASNTSSATARLAQITNVYSESATTTSTNYIVITNVAHGLTPDSYVLITGVPTGCTTISSAVNSSTTLRRVLKVNGINAFTISAGTSKTKNIKTTGDFTNANLYVYIPSNLGIPSTSPSTITIVNDDLIRLDFPSTSATTATTLNTTQWNRYGHPKIKFRLDGVGWTRTANTVRVNHSLPDYNIFSVDDYIGIVCYSQDNAVYFSNVKNPNSKFLWSKITAANTAAAWFEFTVDSSKFSGATSGTFGTSTAYGFDYFFKPFRTQSASNTTFNFRRTYTNAPVQYVNSTAFRIGSAPTVDDNLFTSNIASSSATISLTTGAVQANTDRASSAVLVSSGALAGPGTISTTSTTASACTFISPYAEVANSSATVKITASTFYNGNSTANVFVNSTSFEIATSTDKKVANSSAIVMGQLSGGVLDTTKPSFFANSSYIQIGPDSSRKFWRAGIIGGVAKTEIGGSEFSVGTETNNTTIVDSSITLTDGIVTNYISSNGIQLNSNVDISGPLSIANNYGSAGQILYTDGANPYWGDVPGFDSNIPYTFYQPLTLGNDINSNGVFSTSDENSNYAYVTPTGFDVVANNNQSAALFGNGITFTSNSQDTATSTTVYANSSVLIVGNSTVNATINSTSFSGNANTASTANNATYAYGKSESALNVNSALTSNNSTNLGGVAASGYQTTAGLSANVATLAANSATYILANSGIVSNSAGVFVKANNGITVNATGVFVTQGTGTVVNATGVHVNSSYIGTLSANNASYLGTVAAASYVQNTDSRTLSGNLTFSANITVNGLIANGSIGSAGQTLTSNGTTVYWSTPATATVNTSAQYTWSNTQTFSSAPYLNNDVQLRFKTVNSAAYSYLVQQSDDNFVFYTTDGSYSPRAIFSIYANSSTSDFQFGQPVRFNSSNVTFSTGTALFANGSAGAASQVLTSNGTGVYWAAVSGSASVNLNAQYVWSNLHTFQANVAFTGNNISVVSNTGSVMFGGAGDTNWRIGRSTGATTKFYYTNNSLDIIAAASNLEGFVIGQPGGNTYLETGYAGTFTKNPIYVGNATVNATINSTTFTGTANNASYLGGTAASGYQTTAGLSANVATLTANNANNLGGVAASSYVNTSGNYTLAGNLNFTGTNTYFTSGFTSGSNTVTIGTATYFVANGNVGVGTNSPSALLNVVANTSYDAVRITQTGAGNALVVEDSANPDSTPFVIDSAGRVISGFTGWEGEWFASSTTPDVFSIAQSTNAKGYASINYGGPGGLFLARSNGTNIGDRGIVSSGDFIGNIAFGADDGASAGYLRAAMISSVIDGAPGTESMPGRLTFWTTANGATVPTERMRIDSAGRVSIGTSGTSGTLRLGRALSDASSYGAFADGQLTSAATTIAAYFRANAGTSSNYGVSYTIPSIRYFSAYQATFHPDSTVSNQYGFISESGLVGATNNYGFYSNVPAGTSRTITNVDRTTNVVTITTSVAHGYTAGQSVTVAATTTTGVNGTFTITAVPTTSTFTYAQTGTDIVSTVDTGSTVVVGRWNFYAAGDAPNYFAGSIAVGGTNNARAQVHILGSGSGQATAALTDSGARNGMLRISDNSTLAGAGGAVLFASVQGDNANSVGFSAIKGLLTNGSNNTTGDLAISTRNTVNDTSLTERIRILAGGNVGIANTAPDATLAVTGTANISSTLVVGGALTAANLTTTTNVATFGTAAYIVSGGNVGIANSSPADKLSVNGTGYFNANLTTLQTAIANTFLVSGSNEYLSQTTGADGWYFANLFSVSAQETEPRDLSFSSNGSLMYVLGNIGKDITVYTLGTPWQVSTATGGTTTFSVNSQETAPLGLTFKPDGTAFYIVGNVTDTVYQYTMSTPWDLTTASYASKSFSVTTQDTSPMGVEFSSDGTKMYMVGTTTNGIYQYNLSVAWDVSTASYASKSLIHSGNYLEAPQGIAFNSDGTKLYTIGSSYYRLTEFTLGTAWDLATATYNVDSVVSNWGTYLILGPSGIYYNESQNTAYISDYQNDAIFQLSTTPSSKLYGSKYTIQPDVLFSGNIIADRNIRLNGELRMQGTATVAALAVTGAVTFSATSQALSFGTSQTTGTVTVGGTTQTGVIQIGRSTANQTIAIANGATISGNVKTISFGENGAAGSQTNITIGSSLSNTLITVNANNTNFSGTINAASHTTGATGTGTGGLVANTTIVFLGNNTINAAVNTTSLYIGGNVIANSTGANNAFNLGGVAAASYVNTSGAYTLSGNLTLNGNLTIGTSAGISATGSYGTSGQVLTSNGTTVYWSTPSSGTGSVSNVASGNGLIGGPITTTGTLSVLANNGIISNSTGVFVFGNTGLVVNATGVHVNSSYVQSAYTGTLSGNVNFTGSNVYFSSGLFGSLKPRVNTSTSFANALAWNSDNFDQYISTAQAANLTISADSGSPTNGQRAIFRIKDNGGAQTLSFTTGTSKSFRAIGTALPTTTVASKTLYVGAVYNSDDARWDVIATAIEA